MSIVTHQNPDLDAIAGVWLLKRFSVIRDEDVHFVNTGNPDPELLEGATAVVDTGKQYDPIRLRFDHHQLPGQSANDTSATKQVFDYLLPRNPTIEYLRPLIDIVFAGDTGRSEANASRELGLHAIFSGWKAWWSEQNPDQKLPDQVAFACGCGLLDVLEVRLRKQAEARAELAEKVVYKSEDGMVWAIRFGSVGLSFAAYDEGARIVVFEGEPIEVEGGTSYPVGIMRAGEWQEPHTGNLVKNVLHALTTDYLMPKRRAIKLINELGSWFLHPAGFFSGRGTAKAPVFKPVSIDLLHLAKLIDKSWSR